MGLWRKKWRLCTDSSSSMFCGCASTLRWLLVILELPFPPIRLCSSCLAKEMSWGATNLLHLRRTWENYSLCVTIQGWTEFKSFYHMESNQNRCPYMTKHIQRSSKRSPTRPQRAVINGWMKTCTVYHFYTATYEEYRLSQVCISLILYVTRLLEQRHRDFSVPHRF